MSVPTILVNFILLKSLKIISDKSLWVSWYHLYYFCFIYFYTYTWHEMSNYW